jgi:glycosyltransferase involved in cell wall biosynthesis
MASEISLAVMVRDDAERLGRCLLSARDFVDEIVVLDTGSIDDSIAVAREFGARIGEIVWPNDFSQALNVLLSMVKTTWTFRLDSDEWIDADQMARLRDYAGDNRVSAYTIVRRDLTNAGVADETEVLRLWRTHEKIRYDGVVHETIGGAKLAEAWPEKKPLRSEIFFWHDGYLGDAIDAKAARNLALLRIDAEKRPESLEVDAMLTMALYGMQDPEGGQRMEALMDRFLAADLAFPGPAQVAQAVVIYLEALSKERASEERTSRIISKAVRLFARNPVILFYAGVTERVREDFPRSLEYLLALESLVRSQDYDRSMSVPEPFVGEKMWRALGFVATKLGRNDIVARCRKGLEAVTGR